MGRPKKPEGTRVTEQFHIGTRFEAELAQILFVVLAHVNMERAKEGKSPETASGLCKHYIRDGLADDLTRFKLVTPSKKEEKPTPKKSAYAHLKEGAAEAREEAKGKIKIRQGNG